MFMCHHLRIRFIGNATQNICRHSPPLRETNRIKYIARGANYKSRNLTFVAIEHT